MKTLYESLLDDFEELGSKQDKAVRAEILQDAWFRLGADSKTIIFEPSALDHLVDDRDTTPGVYWEEGGNHARNISDLSVCKDLGLKFQPLNFIVDDLAGKGNKWLKYFDCEYTVNFSMITGQGTTPDIDLSMIKFPIKGSITISGYANKINSLKPYPHPVEIVRILREPATSSVINGWKCKHMVITSVNNIVFHITKDRGKSGVTTEEYDQILIEWVNEILKNNPDVENLYLGQCSNFSDNRRVVTKGRGANRVCVKFVRVPQAKWNDLIYNDSNSVLRSMANEVDAWRWKHEDLFECECAPAAVGAATPGNTLGIGNPMAPTATEPGTEPIIPKHPRNKKDKKKLKSLKESLLDDFDKMSDFQDIEMILDDPNFNKNNFNKLKRLFKKAGGGEDYGVDDNKNESTYFIAYDRGGLNNTSEVIVGIPAVAPILSRTYFPGYRHVYDAEGVVQLHPHIWAIHSKVPAKNHFGRNTSGPISIPDKYVPYFEKLIQNAPESGSDKFFELTNKRKKW